MEWTRNMDGGGTLYFRDDGGYLYFEARRSDDGDGLYQVLISGGLGSRVLGTMVPCEGGLKLCRMVSRSAADGWGCFPVREVVCERYFVFATEGSGSGCEKKSCDVDFVSGNESGDQGENLLENQFGEGDPMKEKRWAQEGEETYFQDAVAVVDEEVWLEVVEGVGAENHEDDKKEVDFTAWICDSGLKKVFGDCVGVVRKEYSDGFVLGMPFSVGVEFPVVSGFCFGEYREMNGAGYLFFSFSSEGNLVFSTRNLEIF